MVVTVVIAIGSSAATSYLVTTKYPRFVNITGAHEISIESSKVEIWEQIESTKKEKTNDRYKIK
jgi:hypothetical protein